MNRSLADRILFITLAVFVCSTCAMLVLATYNHYAALKVVEAGLINEKAAAPDAVISKLQLARKDLFDSNTITFLFNLLVLTVVNLAVYLHTRSLDGLKRSEQLAAESAAIAQAVATAFETALFSSSLSVLYARTERLASEMARPETNASNPPVIRDMFNMVCEQIQQAKDNRVGMDPITFSGILDGSHRLVRTLKRLRDSQLVEKEVATDLLERNKRCMDLLVSFDFVACFKSIRGRLRSSSGESASA